VISIMKKDVIDENDIKKIVKNWIYRESKVKMEKNIKDWFYNKDEMSELLEKGVINKCKI